MYVYTPKTLDRPTKDWEAVSTKMVCSGVLYKVDVCKTETDGDGKHRDLQHLLGLWTCSSLVGLHYVGRWQCRRSIFPWGGFFFTSLGACSLPAVVLSFPWLGMCGEIAGPLRKMVNTSFGF